MRKPSRKQEKDVRVKQLKHDDPSSGDSSSEEVGEEEEEGEVWRERNALEDEQREHALRKQLETLKNLPKNSRYARHRIPVLERCLLILGQSKRTRSQETQLSKLLAQLNIKL